GLPSNAYKQIIQLGGLESENQYPYRGRDEKCQFKKQDVDVYINGSVKISSNEDDMAAWLASKGPISIGINAMAMQFYLGGVAHPWKIFCNPSELDHGVLIVGYGVKKS
ncbi:C1 family peptidase, partial [Salmonella sp. s54412]|uniref:C1 family peptidase n=1 Tax=Salmonella sp. s54412 TaxID=3160128 RepID=UPI0037547583